MTETFYPDPEGLKRYERPEDELETPGVNLVNRRERKFVAKGGFKEMLNLKVFLQDLQSVYSRGILEPVHDCGYVEDVINDPKTHAWSSLGFDVSRKAEDIKDDELKEKLDWFLEKFKKNVLVGIDEDIKKITEYKERTKSIAMEHVMTALGSLKELLLEGDFKSFARKYDGLIQYLYGMRTVYEFALGPVTEGNDVRQVLKAPMKKEQKDLAS